VFRDICEAEDGARGTTPPHLLKEVRSVVLVRRFAIALLGLVVSLVQLVFTVVAGLAFLAAGLVMAVIALAILAFMAAEEKCGRAAYPQTCAGSKWSVASETL
jgi:hypothetical protein